MAQGAQSFIFGGQIAFVPHPAMATLWVKTHVCVALVACPMQGCESAVGVPCRGAYGRYMSSTHEVRRRAALAVVK